MQQKKEIIQTVWYKKLFNTGDFTHEEIGVYGEGKTLEEAFTDAKLSVNWLRKKSIEMDKQAMAESEKERHQKTIKEELDRIKEKEKELKEELKGK